MPARVPPNFAELLAHVGVPLVLVVSAGQPVCPLMTGAGVR
ncbi:MAG: hypothetical protein OJF49_003049 [Ktedonobacterales bacterium]|jgi:hypothetical protein|nr:MAG: hypothetical protein OJF49_003049 [Ktedonobacterales bacterium]